MVSISFEVGEDLLFDKIEILYVEKLYIARKMVQKGHTS